MTIQLSKISNNAISLFCIGWLAMLIWPFQTLCNAQKRTTVFRIAWFYDLLLWKSLICSSAIALTVGLIRYCFFGKGLASSLGCNFNWYKVPILPSVPTKAISRSLRIFLSFWAKYCSRWYLNVCRRGLK